MCVCVFLSLFALNFNVISYLNWVLIFFDFMDFT